MKKILILLLVTAVLAACKNNSANKAAQEAADQPPKAMETKAAAATDYSVEMVSNKKDPICGMPVTAGISDTALYGGKSYGFCSPECKDEFKKTPLAYMKEME